MTSLNCLHFMGDTMTLQQEIVESLRDAQQEINTLRYHAGLSSTNYRFEQLAARVEKARCELCIHSRNCLVEELLMNDFFCNYYQEKMSK